MEKEWEGWRDLVRPGCKHVLRVTPSAGSPACFEASSAEQLGAQGMQLCFVGLAGVVLPLQEMEVVADGEHVLLAAGPVSAVRREHDGWKGFTSRTGAFKLAVTAETLAVTAVRCTVHLLAYTRQPLLRVPPAAPPVSRSQLFADWRALVTLRGEGGVLFERLLVLRATEVASEARQTLCLTPEGFEGAAVARPLASREPDRLRLVADWALWPPGHTGAPARHASLYLWAQRHRQFPTLYEAVSLNHDGCGVRFAVQDPSGDSRAATSLLAAVTVDVTLPLMRDWLGARQTLSLRDVAGWIASQRQQ